MRQHRFYPTNFFALILIAAFLSLGAISIFGQSKTSVRISAETTVDGDSVVLAQIAEIYDASEMVVSRLKNVSLGYAPNVGMTREINRSQIVLAISAAGFSESEIGLNCPEKILIRREGQTVSREEMRRRIEIFLFEKFAGKNLTTEIKRLDLPENIVAPKGELEIRPNFSAIQNYFQPFILPVEIRVDGKAVRRIAANLEIEAHADVLVAAKDLTANSKIVESDARFEKRRITKPLTSYYTDAEKLRGLTLIKTISNGAEITSDSLVSSVVIRAGDNVRVEALSGKLKIVVSGEARASGRIGDRIAVKNLQSGAILQAVVVDEGLVRINF